MIRSFSSTASAKRGRAFLALAACLGLLLAGKGAVGSSARRAFGHVQPSLLQRSRHLGRHAAADRLSIGVSLAPRDPQGLADSLRRLYDPADPQFHRFLTPQEYQDRFAPTDADVAEVAQALRDRGLRVTEVSGNHMFLGVEGPTAAVESAFALELHDYVAPDGRRVFAPTSDPVLFGAAAERVAGVHGLSTFAKLKHASLAKSRLGAAPRGVGDPYLTPVKLRAAYGTSGLAQTGAGETLALFELDGYNASDITAYTTHFALPAATLSTVLVGGASGAAGADTVEVALDIEVALALAPSLSITVYEGPNTGAGILAVYNKIATDGAAVVSSSWGLSEDLHSASFLASENTVFQQLALQGQSFFAASGDHGAYDDGSSRPSTLVVDDPASQPYVTGVGGTKLIADMTTGAYSSETAWSNTGTSPHTGGGGGISAKWTLPTWQSGLATTANQGSSAMRMVPDVSLEADPNRGYDVYVTEPGQAGGWQGVGGTSAAAPIWAAFTALVNQGRVAGGLSRIGFANPTLYQIAQSSLYATTFHDVADSSTNLYYSAVSGYDLATGLGSPQGAALFSALTSATLPPAAPASFSLSASATAVTLTWAAVTGATSYKVYSSATGTSGTFALLASPAATTYADTTALTMTYYYVTAVNAAGESGASTVLNAMVNESPPGAPPGLSVTVTP